MKKICSKSFLILLCLQIFAVVSLAQENYEIVTFTIPKEWEREIHPNSLSLLKTDETGSNGGLITIFKPAPIDLGSKANFAIWWNSVVRKVVNTTETPQMQPVSNLNGWKVESGIAQFTSENKELNLGKGMAILCSFSGNGKVINILALSNSKKVNDEIFDFVDSIKLPDVGQKEPGKLVKTADRALEIVKYRFTFHYFDDVKSFKLVLQADSPTQRDGAFSSDKTYKNAWYFEDKYQDNDPTKPKAQKF